MSISFYNFIFMLLLILFSSPITDSSYAAPLPECDQIIFDGIPLLPKIDDYKNKYPDIECRYMKNAAVCAIPRKMPFKRAILKFVNKKTLSFEFMYENKDKDAVANYIREAFNDYAYYDKAQFWQCGAQMIVDLNEEELLKRGLQNDDIGIIGIYDGYFLIKQGGK